MTVIFQYLQDFLIQHTLLSPIVYILSHIVFAIFLIPCSPMAVIAGAIWGKWLGLFISILSAFLASCSTFLLSRFYLKKRIYHFLNKRYSRTDWFLEQTKKHGWKFVAYVQLNPAAPGSTLGYLFGLTNIEFPKYAMYLFVFMLPLQLLLVFIGASLSSILTGKIAWLVLEIPIGLLTIYFVYQIINKKINKGIEANE